MQALTPSLLEAVIQIAHQAGEHLKDFYKKSVEIRIKADQTPVTSADIFVNQFVIAQLKKLTPHIPILSEESCKIPLNARQNWQEYWIIDPLDGTQQFIERTDQFSVVIGLVQRNRPILGVIYAPILETTYYAMHANGSFLQKNGRIVPLVAPSAKANQDPLIITMGTTNYAKIAKCLKSHPFKLIKYGSSSLKAGLVAEGKADCYLRFGDTGEWDTAVAEVLLAEMGGRIFDLNFQPLTYNQRDTFINPHFMMVGNRQINWSTLFQFDNHTD